MIHHDYTNLIYIYIYIITETHQVIPSVIFHLLHGAELFPQLEVLQLDRPGHAVTWLLVTNGHMFFAGWLGYTNLAINSHKP